MNIIANPCKGIQNYSRPAGSCLPRMSTKENREGAGGRGLPKASRQHPMKRVPEMSTEEKRRELGGRGYQSVPGDAKGPPNLKTPSI